MPIIDENRNILCVRTYTDSQGIQRQKYHHLNPSVTKNQLWMNQYGWEIVQEPQAPPAPVDNFGLSAVTPEPVKPKPAPKKRKKVAKKVSKPKIEPIPEIK